MNVTYPGECADCRSKNLSYINKDYDADQMIYDYKCDDCGATGKEYYAVEYIETISDDKEA
jgi:hypothetical protein